MNRHEEVDLGLNALVAQSVGVAFDQPSLPCLKDLSRVQLVSELSLVLEKGNKLLPCDHIKSQPVKLELQFLFLFRRQDHVLANHVHEFGNGQSELHLLLFACRLL